MRVSIASNILRYALRNAYFINGTGYAGKSTMVKLLAEKHGGICCGENYHDALHDALSPACQPNLCYFDTMSGWPEFLSRTPEEYDAWIQGVSEEAADLEIVLLLQYCQAGKPVFVDTNIPLDTLRQIAQPNHVAIMLAPQGTTVSRFFDRPDPEKQFLYRQLLAMPEPEKAMENFRRCLEKINSAENYAALENSGFFVLHRDENRTVEETLRLLEAHFGLNT